MVDDHDLVRQGVVGLLSNLAPSVTILDATNLREASGILKQETALDLILLDLLLSDVNGFDGLIALKEISPETPVAIVSGVTDPEIVSKALQLGADGYIPKTAVSDVILHAVNIILQGEIYVPSIVLSTKDTGFEQKDNLANFVQSPESGLTPRQNEVLSQIRNGLSNKEIARKLDCTESTIKTHVSAILSHFDASSRGKLLAKLLSRE